MHILLITDSYPPEIRSAAHLMLELAEEALERLDEDFRAVLILRDINDMANLRNAKRFADRIFRGER